MWSDLDREFDEENSPAEILALLKNYGQNVKHHQPGIQVNFSIQATGPTYTLWVKSFKLFVNGSTLVAHGREEVKRFLLDYL